MNFGYQIKGLEKIRKKFVQLEVETKAAQIRTVQEATLMTHEIAVKSIQENGDGKSQIRYQPKRVVNVSKPGDPPNTDTGRAVASIKFDFKDGGLIGRIGTNLKYLAALEFGTSTTDARPWLAPAINKVSQVIGKMFEKNVKDVLKGVST